MILSGTIASKGIARGHIIVFRPCDLHISDCQIHENQIDAEKRRFADGILTTCDELETKMTCAEEDAQKILAAHLMLLQDVAIQAETQAFIGEGHKAEYAVEAVFEKYIEMFSQFEDHVFRERSADLKDVKNRILRNMLGIEEQNLSKLPANTVLVADELMPSCTASLDRQNVIAIVTERGGITSHSAILARSYGIPALVGVRGLIEAAADGAPVIVDAIEGKVIMNPDDVQVHNYRCKYQAWITDRKFTDQYLEKDAATADGTCIKVCVNVGELSDGELNASQFCDGVGLLRTEFLYLDAKTPPSEEEQFLLYKKILEAFGGKEVTLRTLDVGADKALECIPLPKEDNPSLGLRALRLCFNRDDIFKTQLRAALRASVFGRLNIMFPMVASIDDIRRAKSYVERCRQELDQENIDYDPSVKIGIMIEIPSIALLADKVAHEVDFASVGTNDLCQYLCAADRLNTHAGEYYEPYHPALFRILRYVAKNFNDANKPLSICGELGGEELAVSALIGLGIRKFSMNKTMLASVKARIAQLDIKQCEETSGKLLELETAQQIREYLQCIMKVKTE